MESRRRRPFITNYVSFPLLHATFCEMYTRGRQLHWSHCPCLGSDTVKQNLGLFQCSLFDGYPALFCMILTEELDNPVAVQFPETRVLSCFGVTRWLAVPHITQCCTFWCYTFCSVARVLGWWWRWGCLWWPRPPLWPGGGIWSAEEVDIRHPLLW